MRSFGGNPIDVGRQHHHLSTKDQMAKAFNAFHVL
jgi:hypothetical protein